MAFPPVGMSCTFSTPACLSIVARKSAARSMSFQCLAGCAETLGMRSHSMSSRRCSSSRERRYVMGSDIVRRTQRGSIRLAAAVERTTEDTEAHRGGREPTSACLRALCGPSVVAEPTLRWMRAFAPSVGLQLKDVPSRPVAPVDLHGKTVAIDAPNLLYAFYAVQMLRGAEKASALRSASRSFANRIGDLSRVGARSVVVFDGPP